MRVTHTDSTGKCWVFSIPVQHALHTNMVARLLRHVRNLARTETNGVLRPTDFVAGMEQLNRDIEETILSALAARYPATNEGNTANQGNTLTV